jgi:hypothetical protein
MRSAEAGLCTYSLSSLVSGASAVSTELISPLRLLFIRSLSDGVGGTGRVMSARGVRRA